MKTTETPNHYNTLLSDISKQILQSRYRAARLVNRELLLLYFAVGQSLSKKITTEKWGAKVLEQISADLQRQLPGLRGFSYRNLKNMRQFADVYDLLIGQLTTVQFSEITEKQSFPIGQLTTAQLESFNVDIFLGISFTQHILLLNRCSDWDERWFYMQKTVDRQWTVEMLDWQIKAKAYQKRDQTLPNNTNSKSISRNFVYGLRCQNHPDHRRVATA